MLSNISAPLCLALLALFAPQGPAPTPPIPQLGGGWEYPQPTWEFPNAFQADLSINKVHPGIHFFWKHFPSGDIFGGQVEVHTEDFPVSYWPNTAYWFSDTELLVAGVSRLDGAAVLEKWTFEDVLPSFTNWTDPKTQKKRELWSTPKRVSVQLLYRKLSAPKHEIGTLHKTAPKSRQVYLRFRDSGDLVKLDLDTAQVTLAASPTKSPSALHIPALKQVYRANVGIAMDHPEDGYVLGVGKAGRYELDYLYLIDSNRDGQLDRWIAQKDLEDVNRYLSLPNENWF